MKVRIKRWLLALSVASSLLAFLFYMDRSAPTLQFTRVVRLGHGLLPRSARAPDSAAQSQPTAGTRGAGG